VADQKDPYVALADAALRTFAHASVFGTYLVDYIPTLKYLPSWMPGVSFKRKAREWRRLSREMLESQFNFLKRRMVSRAITYVLRCSIEVVFRLKVQQNHASLQENWRTR
jgi:hypothetical protein